MCVCVCVFYVVFALFRIFLFFFLLLSHFYCCSSLLTLHSHLLFVSSIKPLWSCQYRMPSHRSHMPSRYSRCPPLPPTNLASNIWGKVWEFWLDFGLWMELDFFFFFPNLRFSYVEFNWFLRNMIDFEFWKFIFSVICIKYMVGLWMFANGLTCLYHCMEIKKKKKCERLWWGQRKMRSPRGNFSCSPITLGKK